MKQYSEAAVERMMKVREVILRALAKRITWWQAAEVLGISDRSMRRWRRNVCDWQNKRCGNGRRTSVIWRPCWRANWKSESETRSHAACAMPVCPV